MAQQFNTTTAIYTEHMFFVYFQIVNKRVPMLQY